MAKKKKVAKKATKKKVAKKVTKKKVAKKATKKKVAKKAAKKKVAKKVAKKKVAKKVTTKAIPKSAQEESSKSDVISKEEAIKKYKASLKPEPTSTDDDILDEGMAPEIVESEFKDDTEVLAGGATQAESYNTFDNNQVEEYNPDDEEDDLNSEEHNYGWGYNDSFDNPEEASSESVYEDEDEAYAKGTGPKEG